MRTHQSRIAWFPFALIILGAALLARRFHVAWAGWPALFWLLVIAWGSVKLYNGFVWRSRGRIVWGVIWVVVGGMFLLGAVDELFLSPGIVVGGIFLACGAGLIAAFARNVRDWHLAVPGVLCLLVSGAVLSTETGWLSERAVVPVVSTWWPAGLILFGAALLVHALAGRGEGVSAPPASSSPTPHPR